MLARISPGRTRKEVGVARMLAAISPVDDVLLIDGSSESAGDQSAAKKT